MAKPITQQQLLEVNKKRRDRGRPPISLSEANSVSSQSSGDQDLLNALLWYSVMSSSGDTNNHRTDCTPSPSSSDSWTSGSDSSSSSDSGSSGGGGCD